MEWNVRHFGGRYARTNFTRGSRGSLGSEMILYGGAYKISFCTLLRTPCYEYEETLSTKTFTYMHRVSTVLELSVQCIASFTQV